MMSRSEQLEKLGDMIINVDPMQNEDLASTISQDNAACEGIGHDIVEESIKFVPPLYRQRYDCVRAILQNSEATSVCDFGCAECRALMSFRSIETVQRLVGVDIDRRQLVDYCRRLDPLICDFLFRRSRPLHIDLFHGNLLHYDHRLNGIDAVTLIEVIEHLCESDLALLPDALFGSIAPRLVVITTPNAEFNVLFPSHVGFRHPDHKFEWTRQEFQMWCDSVAAKYHYDVLFGGVGNPPEHNPGVGHCSQYAVFTRQPAAANSRDGVSDSSCAPYECVYTVDYPVADLPRSVEEAVLSEAEYYINVLTRSYLNSDNEVIDDDVISIDLTQLISFPSLQAACCNDIDKLRDVLKSAGYTISDDGSRILHQVASQTHSDVSDYENDKAPVDNTYTDHNNAESALAECWD